MRTTTEPPRLARDPAARMMGGVAAGIANHLNANRRLVRLGFVFLAFSQGIGFLLYAVFWATMPLPSNPRPRNRVHQIIPFLFLGLGMYLMLELSGTAVSHRTYLGLLIALVVMGAGIIWHHSDPKLRERWADSRPQSPILAVFTERDRTAYLLRFVGGGSLIVVGIIGVIAVFAPVAGPSVAAAGYGLIFALVALTGVGLALAPVFWRLFTQLRAEREARIREQERAEVASMIHDQVLHTLALIQRNATDPTTVVRLSRGQERTLRNWLYRTTASPTERFSAGLEAAAAEVEDTYAIKVETVVVGDFDMDAHTAALLAAAREALVNAGKHAGVSSVSLYAEVEPEMIRVYIRDRGAGFDQKAINEDRHGVRGSIIGRMQRHGGKAEIRTEPGEGTEVRLTMPFNGGSQTKLEEG